VATKLTEEIIAAGTSAGVEVTATERANGTGEIVLLGPVARRPGQK
jgi:hypothetical protein